MTAIDCRLFSAVLLPNACYQPALATHDAAMQSGFMAKNAAWPLRLLAITRAR